MPIAAATPHPRFVRALLMAALLALPAAFSAAQVPPATESATRAGGVAPKRVDKPQLDIALVLPLEAPAYALAADAVRSGFLAAADAAGASARCVVIGHGEGGVIAAFETARSAAKVVVGPLVRDDLKVIAGANLELPWTIALNHLEDGAPLSPQIYTFALTIDSDARLLSRRMRDTGAQNIAVISGETPFLQRFAGAFATEWLLAGAVRPTHSALTRVRRRSRRSSANSTNYAARSAPTPCCWRSMAQTPLGSSPTWAVLLRSRALSRSIVHRIRKCAISTAWSSPSCRGS